MYDLYSPRPAARHKRRKLIFAFIILAVLVGSVGGVRLLLHILQPHTTLTQAKATTYYYAADTEATQHVKQSTFAVDLPASWQPFPSHSVPNTVFSWHGTKKDDNARYLEIYIDTIPSTLAVNRLLPVQANGDRLSLIDTTSDNCANFAPKSDDSRRTGVALTKVGKVSFLCDVGNYERDVVAIGSPEGVNALTLAGHATGKHPILLVFTDNSPAPNYVRFENIVKSFRLL